MTTSEVENDETDEAVDGAPSLDGVTADEAYPYRLARLVDLEPFLGCGGIPLASAAVARLWEQYLSLADHLELNAGARPGPGESILAFKQWGRSLYDCSRYAGLFVRVQSRQIASTIEAVGEREFPMPKLPEPFGPRRGKVHGTPRATIGYYESLRGIGRIAEKAMKAHGRERVIDRVVRSAIDAFDAHHGRVPSGHLVCEAEPLDDKTEEALAKHWAEYETMPFTLVGDVYQAVDAAVVKSHAFCQTPKFVGDFIAEHVVRAASEIASWRDMRVLDPSCGGGHLLLSLAQSVEALARRTKAYHEAIDWRAFAKRIIGVELNPYAARIARWQVATWIYNHRAGRDGAVEDYMPTVIDADFLDVCDSGERRTKSVSAEAIERLRELASEGVHAVAMNPPYIVESDAGRKAYDRKRYGSAYMQYGLGTVFVERAMQGAAPGAALGVITSNAFMKREYGKPHVEKVLPKYDLTHVLNTSGAYIPGHGTPTVIMFMRKREPRADGVAVFGSKRGEPSTPADPANGIVWRSLVEAYRNVESSRLMEPKREPTELAVTAVQDAQPATTTSSLDKQLSLFEVA